MVLIDTRSWTILRAPTETKPKMQRGGLLNYAIALLVVAKIY